MKYGKHFVVTFDTEDNWGRLITLGFPLSAKFRQIPEHKYDCIFTARHISYVSNTSLNMFVCKTVLHSTLSLYYIPP